MKTVAIMLPNMVKSIDRRTQVCWQTTRVQSSKETRSQTLALVLIIIRNKQSSMYCVRSSRETKRRQHTIGNTCCNLASSHASSNELIDLTLTITSSRCTFWRISSMYCPMTIQYGDLEVAIFKLCFITPHHSCFKTLLTVWTLHTLYRLSKALSTCQKQCKLPTELPPVKQSLRMCSLIQRVRLNWQKFAQTHGADRNRWVCLGY